ncbi:Phage capsid scaffolding protein (GPO) serine peptidase [Serratia proteamaculans]|uniref:GPO family capsid scaffolding protein n=1 Tax=Serratia proteamaculans TaxID=28151 RepID=UPI00217A041C|nr:GPO family capsid scaffolding protein [Serratia proteamaculans]CAI0810306.1 Phage capsid scaffolding protein (GPO) serine peptidase [Serratia proteamaculans]CAI1597718.1 Phage capsid scaffolding protein (GPO) serine peptidase [Serratia proteamaculans]
MQTMNHIITKTGRNTSRYRGFVITYRPQTVVNKIARYEVSLGDHSFGLHDSKAGAIKQIHQLYAEKRRNTKSKWFLVAIEGVTTDGRIINAAQLKQMATNFNPDLFNVGVCVEFDDRKNLSEVIEVALGSRGGKVALMARIVDTPSLRELSESAEKHQKQIYPAIAMIERDEISQLHGIGITSTPSVLNTDPLIFDKQEAV